LRWLKGTHGTVVHINLPCQRWMDGLRTSLASAMPTGSAAARGGLASSERDERLDFFLEISWEIYFFLEISW